ncbi:hypothetical protein LINPERHAP2_LOCUS1644 [Linum perenne]
MLMLILPLLKSTSKGFLQIIQMEVNGVKQLPETAEDKHSPRSMTLITTQLLLILQK